MGQTLIIPNSTGMDQAVRGRNVPWTPLDYIVNICKEFMKCGESMNLLEDAKTITHVGPSFAQVYVVAPL